MVWRAGEPEPDLFEPNRWSGSRFAKIHEPNLTIPIESIDALFLCRLGVLKDDCEVMAEADIGCGA